MPARRRSPWTRQWLGLLAVMSVVVVLACTYRWFWRLDFALYDASLPTRAAPADVVIVAIDDASIESIGRWPWRRVIHATLLERLRAMGARIVALDILMTEPDPTSPGDDALLASAMSQGLPVVLPLMVRFPRQGGFIREELPIRPLAQAAAAIGHVNVEVDPDGMVRSLFLKEGLGNPQRPYLSTTLISGKQKCEANHPDLEHAPQGVWVRDCQILIPYLGPPGHFAQVSYADVLAGRVSDSAIRGKIVLVGATAQGVGDAWATPLSGGAQAMPGVEILANVLQAQRTGTLIRKVPLLPTILLSLLPIYLLGLALRVMTPRWSMMWGMTIWLTTIAGAVLALQLMHWWWAPSAALLSILALYPLWSWRRLVAAQAFMDEEFARLAGVEQSLTPSVAPPSSDRRALDPVDRRIDLLRTATQLLIDARQRLLTDISEMRKAQRERDDVIRFLSHDMKSPASSLMGLAQLQRDPQRALPPEELSERLDVLAQRTLALVDGFVALARAESVDRSKFDEFDVRDAIQDAYDEVWGAAQARNISISCTAPADLLHIEGDRQLLARAIVNLLNNAVKFSPDGTAVALECLAQPATVLIRITDSGPGIAPEQQALLFQRFTRGVHRGARDPGGAGLGLAFVRVAAEKHGGRVWAENTTGGAVFCLSVPLPITRDEV
ncbi:MAG: CHASE2 domain-containing protein [Proteobacteria bacterium]|nr:CHASE2 domain-containing protein [Pseudomonadota bacterium]